MAQGLRSGVGSAPPTVADEEDMAAIMTKTIIPSPVVRWILHARIRNSSCNDVVFVGDDFVHVKQVTGPGTLQHITTKNDFDARIRAAKVFNTRDEPPDEDLFIKLENGNPASLNNTAPPQCLVLTLSSNDLLFLCLTRDGDGNPCFIQQSCPLPKFDQCLFQPGQHLTVDPQSRAIAVGAHEREVVIYSAKPKASIQHELQTGRPDWCLVSAERPIRIPGLIQHMEFLLPPTDDQGAEDEDHIILLLIVMDQRKTRAIWIDWYASSDLHRAKIHAGQTLDVEQTVPSLLIPLRNAAFLLVHGSEIKHWRDILTGSATSSLLDLLPAAPLEPAASPRHPLWVNWCRPKRGQGAKRNTDHLYLIREDGKMYLLQITPSSLDVSDAGRFECHVGSACASLGDSRDPDIIAVAGDMSNGSVQSIGSWFTPNDVPQQSRRSWAAMEQIETIHNWASVTDMVVSTLPGRSQRSRDSIFVTSGRQPYGAVTELRFGLDACLSAYMDLEGMRSVTDIWALPCVAVGNILILLSSPTGTRILDITSQSGVDNIEEVDGMAVSLDSAHKTFAASMTKEGKIVQITEKSIRLSLGTQSNFEDCANLEIDNASSILAAAIESDTGVAITAVRTVDSENMFLLNYYKIHADDPTVSGDAQVVQTASLALDDEPLCAALYKTSASLVIAMVATARGELNAFLTDLHGPIKHLGKTFIPQSIDGVGICDNIAILKTSSASLAICGLRDGRLYTLVMNEAGPSIFGGGHIIPFGQTAVKLTQPPKENKFALAMSGPDACMLSWSGGGADTLQIQSIWISDRQRPQLHQGPIIACTQTPPAHQLAASDFADSFIAVSGDEFLVATLNTLPGVVPRQIAVKGTPNRLIYSEQQRCLVCASQKCDIQQSPPSRTSHSTGKRVIRPVIDFIPSRSSESSFTYELKPGEKVFALLEWSLVAEHDKIYSFVVVGGSHTRSDGSKRGMLTFLQPNIKNWEVRGVKDDHSVKFDDPVHALALGEDNNIVLCAGHKVAVLTLNEETYKWEHACLPHKLTSPGLQVTVSLTNRSIQVSTLQDGHVSLEVVRDDHVGAGYQFRLAEQSAPTRAEDSLSHIALTASNDRGTTMETGVTMVSTKQGQLIGLRPNAAGHQNHSATQMMFEAELPRSLTRLRDCRVRPRWKAKLPDGMSANDVIGCSTDGSIIGIASLNEHLWRRLSWLQRLCEWSPLISPHSHDNAAYGAGEGAYGRNAWAMPIGLLEQRRHETMTRTDEVAMMEDEVTIEPKNIVMRTERTRLHGLHIDGDLLGRLLKQKDPADTLRDILKAVSSRNDRVGEWVRMHFEQEMANVDEAIALLRHVLDDWM